MNSTAAVLRKIQKICQKHNCGFYVCDCPIADFCTHQSTASNDVIEEAADIIDDYEEDENA